MTWTLLAGIVAALGVAILVVLQRRRELAGMDRARRERDHARERGSARARLQFPHVDLARCLGCGTCVRACPEEGVLELLHGQAVVVHGARCVGHGRCAAECPTGAISVRLGDIERRRDIPVLSAELEAPGQPGLFLAGEVTGYALVRTAIAHGSAVAAEVARRVRAANGSRAEDVLDLAIVGAGPAGLACSLEARARGLAFVTFDQEGLGGTVARYPRRKLVMTQPVDLPLAGRLSRTSYSKEELIELWQRLAREHDLPIREGERYVGLARRADGVFEVATEKSRVLARHVCLALGRRGTPRKLGVPGEELPKVAYGLVDAESFTGRRILVVGGGDSAIEAAMGLADQPGNEVALSYRKHAFFRLKARNEARLAETVAAGRLSVLYKSQVKRIEPDTVELELEDDGGAPRTLRLGNDDVFVMAGGEPPFPLLEAAGVSFDPADRPPPEAIAQGTGLLPALAFALVAALAVLAWTLAQLDYYALPLDRRPDSDRHELLRPAAGVGLACGIAGVTLVLANLAYLLRRSPRVPLALGSLRRWMTAHVATGVLALLFVLVHAAMAPRDTVGGHAFAALAVLVGTGAVGRYLYSAVPRAANGRELLLDEVRAEITRLAAEWDRTDRAFGQRVRAAIDHVAGTQHFGRSFPVRFVALVRSRRALRRTLAGLAREARAEGLAEDQLEVLFALARRAAGAALMATHYEDLRALLGTWRWVHRWVALLMVLLVAAHVATALRFARFSL